MPECFKFHSANIDVCGMGRFCRVLRKNWFSKSKTLKLLLDEFCFSSIYPKSGAKSRECDWLEYFAKLFQQIRSNLCRLMIGINSADKSAFPKQFISLCNRFLPVKKQSKEKKEIIFILAKVQLGPLPPHKIRNTAEPERGFNALFDERQVFQRKKKEWRRKSRSFFF